MTSPTNEKLRLFEPPRLPFNSRNDSFNFARKSIEDSERWLAANNIRRADHHLESKIKLHLYVTSIPDSRIFKLASMVVPFVDVQSSGTTNQRSFGMENRPHIFHCQGENTLMFGSTGQSIERPQNIVTSTVRLELLDERSQIAPDALAFVPHCIREFAIFFCEWEISAVDASRPKHEGAVACCLVKRVAQIGDDIGSGFSHRARNLISETELYYLFSSLRIVLFDNCVSGFFDEGAAHRFKLNDICFSALDE